MEKLKETYRAQSDTLVSYGLRSEIESKCKKERVLKNIIHLSLQECQLGRPYKINCTQEDWAEFQKSISNFGVINPVIVRKVGSKHEVVVGKKRFMASLELGLPSIPAIIKEITDAEAKIIMVETNTHQYSLDQMCHSALAEVVSEYHSALKAQGRRTDLLNEVHRILDDMGETGNLTFRQMGEKLNSAKEVGEKFNLSARAVSRCLRLNTLVVGLKELLDCGVMSVRAAVEASYLTEETQREVYQFRQSGGKPIKYKVIALLREHQSRHMLDRHILLSILECGGDLLGGECTGFSPMSKLFRKYEFYKYRKDEIENIVDKALESYFL